ncbi:MAG: hypothetical protein FJW40_21815 [Acidobacteria bacterium]|nr:hypothetical protein [Acidobacteriota bacterium]
METGSLYPALHRLEKQGVAGFRVGHEPEQPARQVLQADRPGQEATHGGAVQVGSIGACHWRCDESG